MNRQRLTKTIVEGIQPQDRVVVVWDSVVPGFHVKVTPRGGRSYYVYYRTATGRQRRPKLGTHGAITVDEARALARDVLGRVAAGQDPSADRQQLRGQVTLAEFWERQFLPDASSRWKPRTRDLNARLWRCHLAPAIGSRALTDVHREDTAAIHRRMRETPTDANRAISLLRAVLNRAIDWGLLTGQNPASRITPYPERQREVYLSAAQLAALMAAIDAEQSIGGRPAMPRSGEAAPGIRGGQGLREGSSRGISPHAAGLFRLLVYTGARLREIMLARWSFVDWDAGALRLPDSKTGKKVIWLNTLAIAQLERLRAARSQDEWIIEGRVRNSPMNNAQKPWDRVRRHAASALRPADPIAAAQLESLRLHDLRHSFASIAVSRGIPLMVVGKTLGHSEARTTERYAHVHDNPVKLASEAVAERIREMTGAVEPTTPRD